MTDDPFVPMFAEESCNVYSKNTQWWEAGKSFYGGGTRRAQGDTSAKFLKAINIQTGKTAWEIADIGGGILGSGLMATAGGLVFYGDGVQVAVYIGNDQVVRAPHPGTYVQVASIDYAPVSAYGRVA